ncbi:hypothetical protein ZWY2020_043300 [Hordeum vulgare]|nr:hypothetical protein ZWY2020_043300 [Hordeum vulgare]
MPAWTCRPSPASASSDVRQTPTLSSTPAVVTPGRGEAERATSTEEPVRAGSDEDKNGALGDRVSHGTATGLSKAHGAAEFSVYRYHQYRDDHC